MSAKRAWVAVRRFARAVHMPPPDRAECLALAGLGVAIALTSLCHLATLTTYPLIYVDEPWFADAAWNWLQHGVHLESMHAPSRLVVPQGSLRRPIIPDGLFAASFALLGLGLFPARLVSWTFGLFLLLATFWVGKRAYGPLTGGLAALLLSLSPAFSQASHMARPDVILAAMVMGALGLALLALEGGDWWAHFLAGLLLGLGVDVHMNALVFVLALGVCYAVAYGRRLLRRGTWWFGGGVALGLLVYAAAHILPDPAAYFAEQSFSLGVAHAMPIADLSLWSLLDSLRGEVARYDFYNHSLTFGLMAASLVCLACFRRSPRDRFFAAFVVSAFCGMVLMVRYKTPMYAVQTLPVLFLLVAEAMLHLAGSLRKHHQGARAFVLSLLALLTLTSAQHFRRSLVDHQGYDYYAITERIREAIPPGARVMGTPHWWLGLADCDYVSSANLTFFHYSRGDSLRQGLERLRPDVVIVDRYQRMLLTDENPFPAVRGPDVYLLPKADFEAFLTAQGREVLRFADRWHGMFQVYAITWDGTAR